MYVCTFRWSTAKTRTGLLHIYMWRIYMVYVYGIYINIQSQKHVYVCISIYMTYLYIWHIYIYDIYVCTLWWSTNTLCNSLKFLKFVFCCVKIWYICTHTYIYTFIYICIFTHTYIYVYICIYMYVYICMYI